MTDKKENLKKKGVPSFRIEKMITGRGKTTFAKTMRNFALLLSLVAVLVLILLAGHLITKPKVPPVTQEAVKIARAKMAEVSERGLPGADAYAQGEVKQYPHEDATRLIITPSEIEAMELEKERARLAQEKAAEDARKAALGIIEPSEEEKEEEKRDAFEFMKAAEAGAEKAVKAVPFRPTAIPQMSEAKSAGGISVPSGASTSAAFRKLDIAKAKGKVYIPRPASKSYVVAGGQKIERVAPGITSYQGTDKLIGDKWKLTEAGEKMNVGEAAKAAEATKELLKSQAAGQSAGGKASYGGGASASPRIGGSFAPYWRTLEDELKILKAKNKIALEQMKKEKELGLEFKWKEIMPTAIAAAAGEVAKAVGGAVGGILTTPLSALGDIFNDAFGVTPPDKWTCHIDATMGSPSFFGGWKTSPAGCKCLFEVKSKGPGDPPYDRLVDECSHQSPPGRIMKLKQCQIACP